MTNGLMLLVALAGLAVSPFVGQLAPAWLILLGALKLLVAAYASLLLFRMNVLGWGVLVLFELLDIVNLVYYSLTPHAYAIADVELAKKAEQAAMLFGFLFTGFKIGALIYVKKYLGSLGERLAEAKNAWLG